MLHLIGTQWHVSAALGVGLLILGQGGCVSDNNGSGTPDGGGATDGSERDAIPDADAAASPSSLDADVSANSTDADVCARRSATFTDFVAAHSACTSNTDCTVIGDCGPNADFRAIRRDASAQGLELMRARCDGAYDGPLFDAVCVDHACGLQMRIHVCCGCPPDDGGFDGGDGSGE